MSGLHSSERGRAGLTVPAVAEAAPARGSVAWPARPDGGRPLFGFLLLGGPLTGARVRDVRLAHELVRRGFPVHVWWVGDRADEPPLDPAIRQHWLFHSARLSGWLHRALGQRAGRAFGDRLGRALSRLLGASRHKLLQRRSELIAWSVRALVREVIRGVESDRALIRRFAGELTAAGVTHLLPSLAVLGPLCEAVRGRVPQRLDYLVTFQGYEVYANLVHQRGYGPDLYERLRQTVENSRHPAVSVSPRYSGRIVREVGLSRSQLLEIPPGIPPAEPMDRRRARRIVREALPERRPEVPLISYIGRQDAEKGIDLLLYAARILRNRGIEFQLAVCGPTAFGREYHTGCRQIAENLRLPVLWGGYLSEETKTALYRVSRCVVYPSVHEEPFGMVPVEAMAQGTPCVVPDAGGVSGVIEDGNRDGGLRFRAWDSGGLAEQLVRLVKDHTLWTDLSRAAPSIARRYTVSTMADRLLAGLGVPVEPDSSMQPVPSRPARRSKRREVEDAR